MSSSTGVQIWQRYADPITVDDLIFAIERGNCDSIALNGDKRSILEKMLAENPKLATGLRAVVDGSSQLKRKTSSAIKVISDASTATVKETAKDLISGPGAATGAGVGIYVGSAGAAMGGAAGGAAVGAVIGALFGGVGAIPGAAVGAAVGTISGAVVGGTAGLKAGSLLGKRIDGLARSLKRKVDISRALKMNVGKDEKKAQGEAAQEVLNLADDATALTDSEYMYKSARSRALPPPPKTKKTVRFGQNQEKCLVDPESEAVPLDEDSYFGAAVQDSDDEDDDTYYDAEEDVFSTLQEISEQTDDIEEKETIDYLIDRLQTMAKAREEEATAASSPAPEQAADAALAQPPSESEHQDIELLTQ